MTAIVLLQTGVVTLYLAFWGVLRSRQPHEKVNRAVRLWLLFAMGWAVAEFAMLLPFSYGAELYLKRTVGALSLIISFALLRLFFVVTNQRYNLVYHSVLALTAVGAALTAGTDLVIAEVVRQPWWVADIHGPLQPAVAVIPGLAGVYGLTLLALNLRQTDDPNQRAILGLLLTGTVLAFVAGYTANEFLPALWGEADTPQLGSLVSLPLVLFIHRAISKHNFLSLEVEQVAGSILDNLRDGVVLVDRGGRIQRVNPAARRLFGLDDRPLTGLPVGDLPGGHLFTQENESGETEVVHDAGPRHLAVALATQRGEDDAAYKVFIVRDITEQKNADAAMEYASQRLADEIQRRKTEMSKIREVEHLGTTTGTVAHDLHNFLAVINGFATASRNDLPRDHWARRDLREVVDAVFKARDLVNKVLAFSRRAERRPRDLDIAREIRETTNLFKVSLPANIELSTVPDRPHPLTASLDPGRLRQALMNVLTNAQQAIDPAGGRIEVHLADIHVDEPFALLHPPLLPGRHAHIEVRDTGHGMDHQITKRVFEPFFTTHRHQYAAGLGLSTSLQLVQDERGTIALDSTPGKGSTFSIYLPIAPPTEATDNRSI